MRMPITPSTPAVMKANMIGPEQAAGFFSVEKSGRHATT
jgi:hypothetical protein